MRWTSDRSYEIGNEPPISDDALTEKAARALARRWIDPEVRGEDGSLNLSFIAGVVVAAVRDQIAAKALREIEQEIADRYERIYRPTTATRAAFATIRDLILARADRLDAAFRAAKEADRG